MKCEMNSVVNTMELNAQTYSIEEVELRLPLIDDVRLLFLSVTSATEAGGFGLWEVEVRELDGVDELDGKRIHIKPNGECYDDDTLGSDMIGACETSELNYWRAYRQSYIYGDILVDFMHVEGRKYRVHFECTLTDSDKDPEDLTPDDYSARGSADFVVEVDEKNPYDD